MVRQFALALSISLFVQQASADTVFEVRFTDGNPHDRFQFSLIGCPIYDAELEIDLRNSASQVLIDTEYGGTGTQDPMPVEVEDGELTLLPSADGSQILKAQLAAIKEGETATITLDADDALSRSHNDRVEVDGPEISGALFVVSVEAGTVVGTFEDDGVARVILSEDLVECPPLLS